jgi:hypothetical protein
MTDSPWARSRCRRTRTRTQSATWCPASTTARCTTTRWWPRSTPSTAPPKRRSPRACVSRSAAPPRRGLNENRAPGCKEPPGLSRPGPPAGARARARRGVHGVHGVRGVHGRLGGRRPAGPPAPGGRPARADRSGPARVDRSRRASRSPPRVLFVRRFCAGGAARPPATAVSPARAAAGATCEDCRTRADVATFGLVAEGRQRWCGGSRAAQASALSHDDRCP